MTDKEQIIIDGVDVIGCDFIAKEDIYCSYSGEYTAYKGQCGCSDEEMCKNNPKCFYKKTLKQLSRKTQGMNSIHEYYKELHSNATELANKNIQLKEQLEGKEQELYLARNEVHSKTEYIQEQRDIIKQLQQECEELKEKFKKFFGIDNQECWDIAFLKDENARYRKALDEIEGILYNDDFGYCPLDDTEDCHLTTYKNIIDIINKTRR